MPEKIQNKGIKKNFKKSVEKALGLLPFFKKKTPEQPQIPSKDIGLGVNSDVHLEPDRTFFEMISDTATWFNNLVNDFYDYLSPAEFRELEPTDPGDKMVLAQQKRRQQIRDDLAQKTEKRKSVIRSNYEADVSRAQQKRNICTNWYQEQVAILKAIREGDLGVTATPDVDPSTIPGWEVNHGQSNYQGHSTLCTDLMCSDPTNQLGGFGQANCQEYKNQAASLAYQAQQCLDEKTHLDHQLEELKRHFQKWYENHPYNNRQTSGNSGNPVKEISSNSPDQTSSDPIKPTTEGNPLGWNIANIWTDESTFFEKSDNYCFYRLIWKEKSHLFGGLIHQAG